MMISLEEMAKDKEEEVEEATPGARYRIRKVVRKGKFQRRKLNVGKPKRLNAKQKNALKKARRKANTSVARRKRKRSDRVRKSRGLS